MKFLSYSGLEYFYGKLKSYISTQVSTVGNYTINGVKVSTNPTLTKSNIGLGNVTNDAQVKRSELGVASGVATLGEDSKLTASQLPSLKTVNGKSIVGSGNIGIDLSIFKVVTSLPTSGIDVTKVYLVKNGENAGNIYIEYLYVNNAWEEIGTFKSEVDLTPYVKKSEVVTTLNSTSTNPVSSKAVYDALKSMKDKVLNVNGHYITLDKLSTEARPFGILSFDRSTAEGNLSTTYISNGICPSKGNFVWVRVLNFTSVAGVTSYTFDAYKNSSTGTPVVTANILVPEIIYKNGGEWVLCEVLANYNLKPILTKDIAITNSEIDTICT